MITTKNKKKSQEAIEKLSRWQLSRKYSKGYSIKIIWPREFYRHLLKNIEEQIILVLFTWALTVDIKGKMDN